MSLVVKQACLELRRGRKCKGALRNSVIKINNILMQCFDLPLSSYEALGEYLLCLSFLICEVGVVFTSKRCLRIK